jgi:5-methylcytosine-specific restriction enzyme A
MPTSAARPCAIPGCHNLARGSRVCVTHQQRGEHAQEQGRRSAASQGYDAIWRRLRKMILAQSPLCADPYGIHAKDHQVVAATDVDHIIAKKRGGSDHLENLRALCHACHSRKTAREDR